MAIAGRSILAALSASSGVGCRLGDEKRYLSCPEVERGEGRDDKLESGKTQWTRRGMGMRLEDKGTRIEGTESRDAGLEIQLGSRKDRGRRGRTGDAKKMWD